jgi:peptidoglycan/LPS O-acetylase OafA/YrhL
MTLSGADYRFFGGYRLALAWLVLTSHASAHLPGWVGPLALGNVGVFAFFVLSGFVIAEACHRFYPGAPLRFFGNRLLRIYPTYWIACAVAMAIYLALGHPELRLDAVSVIANLNILYAPAGTFFWLSLIWAVGIELRFYFVAALLSAAQRLLPRAPALVFGAFGAGALALYLVTVASDYTRFATFRHAPFFMLGMAAYYAVVCRSRRGTLVTLLTLPFAIHSYYAYNLEQLTTTLLFVATIAAMAPLGRMVVSQRMARLDKVLGDLTYPLYLTHWPVVYLVEKTLPLQGFAAYCAIGALSLLLTGGVLLLEQPVTRLRDRVRRRRLYD